MGKELIIIPSYNERGNLELLIPFLRKKFPEMDLLVVDDSSPDGSAELVKRLAKEDKALKLILREKKEGLGYALFSGYKFAFENGYQKVIQMDADFSHPPRYIPALLNSISQDTVVICSRYVEGGGSQDSFRRIFISRGANFFVRFFLKLEVKDATSGYRGFPRSFLNELMREKPGFRGYLFQVEVILKALKLGYKVREIPFIYEKRKRGKSKLDIFESMKSGIGLLRLSFKRYD